ncbi:MAG: hypothetical protein ACRDZU_17655 [Acidimicrobiales bacterium]
MVAIRGAEIADRIDLAEKDPSEDQLARVVESLNARSTQPREVTALDVDVLRTRLELLHDMADDDRRERESLRVAVGAGLTEMAQRVHDVQRDHRGIRQTLGDLANIVNRQMADGSAVRTAFDELRNTVVEVRDEGRNAVEQVQRNTKRSVEQLEAHARTDRDWILAAQAHVERLAGDLARHDRETASLRGALERADAELLRQRASELEHIGMLREQLAEAVAVIEEVSAVVKRQAGQITKLRADLKKTTAPPAPAVAAKKPATKATTNRTSRAKPGHTS